MIVVSLIVVSFGLYLLWFGLVHHKSVATEAEPWGQFGDYIGGLLNPLVAYSAFYWLTRSVRLQKEELFETRRALEESGKAQNEQAAYARASARLAALTGC